MQDGLDPTPGINNEFATIPDVSVDAIANRVAPRQVASGVTRGIQQLGGENVYSDGGNSQIIVKDTVPRVLMGNQTSFGEGFYVSKSGVDATTNTDSTQWIFNSNQNVFKIAVSATSSIPAVTLGVSDTVWNSVTVAHGLSYIPVLQAYGLTASYILGYFPGVATFANAYVSLPYTPPVKNTNVTTLTITCAVDATNVYFSYFYSTNAGGGFVFPAIPIRYYLLQETAT